MHLHTDEHADYSTHMRTHARARTCACTRARAHTLARTRAQMSMRIMVRAAAIQNASRLVAITQAHLDSCIYIGRGGLSFAQVLDVCVCVCVCVHARTRTHTHAHARTRTHMHAHARTRAHTHAHARARTHTHTRTHECARAHTHTHTHTQLLLDRGGRVAVPTTMNAISVDQRKWRESGVAATLGEPSSQLADAYVRLGAQVCP